MDMPSCFAFNATRLSLMFEVGAVFRFDDETAHTGSLTTTQSYYSLPVINTAVMVTVVVAWLDRWRH